MSRPRTRATAAAAQKVSVSLPADELGWARGQAKRLGKSLSAVLSEALRKQKQAQAWAEVRGWILEGQRSITRKELDAVERTWKG